MSNYCSNCSYKVNKKNGSDVCPLNYLYWNFLVTNRKKLENNPRIAMMYKSYDRMSNDKKNLLRTIVKNFYLVLHCLRVENYKNSKGYLVTGNFILKCVQR